MRIRSLRRLVVLLGIVASITIVVEAQNKPSDPAGTKPATDDQIDGQYEGSARGAAGDVHLSLELKNDQGKVSGRLVTPQGPAAISEGTFTDGKLVLTLGSDATLTATRDGNKLTGEWVKAGEKRSIELTRVPVSMNSAANPPNTDAATLTGDWDGLADAQGEGFPFLLTLKIDGETVTGSSSSSLGTSTISKGTWKDGKLIFQLDSPNGTVSMSAVMKDGGLVGEFDYNGQLTGGWVAKKRNP
jgi:hypothetical protein